MKLVVTDPAWESLDQLTAYWSEFNSDARVNELLDELWKHVGTLLQFPRGAQIEETLRDLGQGHRRMVVGKVKIIYLVEGENLIITDFFDARQDPRGMKP